jgi:hypothetical protein
MNTTEHPDLDQMVIPEVLPPQPDNLATIVTLSKQLVLLQEQKEQQAETLAATDKAIKDLAEKQLPDLMTACGLTELNLTSGEKILVKPEYYANISKDRADAAYRWLREHNMGGILKEKIVVELENQTALAEANIPFVVDATIHPSTLKSFVKERVESGEEFPRELFGVHVVDKAVIK